jgi:glycine/D-amino acid oxidase-like deaminating enzyme
MVSAPVSGADCVVIGDGLIGLSTALELSLHAKICIIGGPSKGIASTAAAGLLIPALERLPAAARPFYTDSLRRFPALLDTLRRFDPDLRFIPGMVDRTGGNEITREQDGAVDNVRLLGALRAAVGASPNVTIIEDLVDRIEPRAGGIAAHTGQGRQVFARCAVLAAGAWSPSIAGLPRPLPVRPLKGQMIALRTALLSQAVMGDDVYLVPRDGETLIGATVEEAGFDVSVTEEAIVSLRASAVALFPELATAELTRAWAGIRPATPDMLPILGADPDLPALIYACGHSKNGVLLTPGTAAAIAAECLGEPTPTSIDPFSVTRFFS